MPTRRLEDRIRELCAQAVEADDTVLPSVMSELRSVMREHIERLRKMAVRQLAGQRQHEQTRRQGH